MYFYKYINTFFSIIILLIMYYDYDSSLYTLNRTTISSTLFATNIIHLYSKNDNWYFYSFIILLFTSILYHQTKNTNIGIVDKLCVANIICRGGTNILIYSTYDLYTVIVIIGFFSASWLYNYGYITKQYIFNENETIGNNYHMLLHLISSISHHIIIYKIN